MFYSETVIFYLGLTVILNLDDNNIRKIYSIQSNSKSTLSLLGIQSAVNSTSDSSFFTLIDDNILCSSLSVNIMSWSLIFTEIENKRCFYESFCQNTE